MRKRIFIGIATLAGSLGIKLCRNVSSEYVKQHKDNPTTVTKVLEKASKVINAVADALDLALRTSFVVSWL